jgi:catechol 2,3-dioxygenase-like lactoylglutathione lyase family enzyme
MTILHHSGICVADIDAALRFYRDGIGLNVLVDKVIEADLESLLGRHTRRVRTVFLGAADHPDGAIVELLDMGLQDIADATPQPGLPNRGVFLLSFQVDVPVVLARLKDLGLGGSPRTMATPRGGLAATVVDPDGVMVELLPGGRAVLS